jgi:excisionase family DNA binding protein
VLNVAIGSNDFPNGHNYHYSHTAVRRTEPRWGSRDLVRTAEEWCVMSSTDPSGRDLSEVSFLTVAEVAKVMRVSKMTVYRLVHSGDLAAVRFGRSFRVPEDVVNEYLRKSYFQAG